MRIITLIFITIIVAIPAHSQVLSSKTEFGIKSGINSSNAYKNQFYKSNTKSIIGFYFGGFANFKISKKFAFQAELVYSRQGFKEYINDPNLKYDQKIKLDYFNFPLNFQYIINAKIHFETGIQLDYLTQATADVKYYDNGLEDNITIRNVNVKDDFKSISYGINIGTGYHVTKQISVNARYHFGLANISDFEDTTVRNRNFQIGLGYSFK